MNKFMPPRLIFKKVYREDWTFDVAQRQFDEYFEREIKPLFENAVEVWGDGRVDEALWSSYKNDRTINQTHSALLINIQPIAPESADEILREIVGWLGQVEAGTKTRELVEKARKYLERANG
jgi:hypothetical protein